jgi:predicted P-loop ATPase
MNPGCQFDTALTLVGAAGGERKSTFFEVLAGRDYYRSSLAKIDNQQAVGMNLRGMWIVELGELSAMKANEKEAFKEFITRRKEQFNAKYERAEAREDRQCGIAATTNTIEFLDRWDQAIRRRFWPVTAAKRIDISWVREHRDQLWSEAYAAYMAGEMWWYDDEAALDETKEKYIAATPTEEKLLEYLGDPSKLPTVNGQNATTITQMVLGLQGAVPLGVRQQVALLLAKYGKEYGLERQRKRGLTTYRVIEKVTGA